MAQYDPICYDHKSRSMNIQEWTFLCLVFSVLICVLFRHLELKSITVGNGLETGSGGHLKQQCTRVGATVACWLRHFLHSCH